MSALEELEAITFSQPFASTSRAVFTLPYRPPVAEEVEEETDFGLYDQAWGECSTKIHATLSTLHDASLDQIVHFVAEAKDDSSALLLKALLARSNLRTGLIIGASPGSSSFLFSALCRQLTQVTDQEEGSASTTCLVSRFASRDCANFKSAMRSLIAGFLGSTPAEVENDEDEENAPIDASSTGKSSTLAPEDFQNLIAWYNHHYRRNGSKTDGPTLVVLLEDLEAMNANVLSRMISTLSHYVDAIPMVLLIGVATSSTALFAAIPRPIANLLDATTFFVEPGVGAFTALIRGLFIDSLPHLALGPKVYQYLWKVFENSHHSIDATVSGIQYIYMHHFTTKSYASATLPSSLNNLSYQTPDLVTSIQSLPSYIDFLAADGTDPQVLEFLTALRGEGPEFYEAIGECWKVRKVWQKQLARGFRLLEMVQRGWERERGIEGLLLAHSEGKLDQYSDELCTMILKSNSAKLAAFLDHVSIQFNVPLETEGEEEEEEAEVESAILTNLKSDSEKLVKILAEPRLGTRNNLVNSNVDGSDLLYGDDITSIDREFSSLIKQISERLRDYFRFAFRPSSDLLLHELWFSNDPKPLRRFHPSILPTIHKSLTMEEDDETIGPDVTVAYKLYRDTGKTINLGDWWGAFEGSAKDEVEDGDGHVEMNGNGRNGKNGKGKGKRRRQEEEEESDDEDDEEKGPLRRKQARFLRALGDLAYVGFLQPTTRKAEHVLKSVF